MRRVRWLVGLLAAACAWGQGIQAGTARRDITPREPLPMWGYGDRHDALSQGVLDPLYADALVIQADGRKIAIVGLDLGRSPAEASLQRIRRRIQEQGGIEYSIIAGSHTHHGPVLELTGEAGKGQGRFDAALRYYEQMEDGIVAAILEANAKLAPARIAVGSTQLEGFNRNRQTKIEPKASDRELAVMRFDNAAGKPVAIVVNFAAHPTMLPASTLRFSADYVGALKAEVTRETGAAAIFLQGAAGDQSVNASQGYEAFGQALGREAVQLANSLDAREAVHAALDCREERFRFDSRTDFANPRVRAAFEKAFFPELIPNYLDEYADGIRPRLTVALLDGEIALVAVSGEFFSNHAIRLRQRARVKQLFFVGYANGYHQYFPTIEAVAEGGYGADNAVSPAAVGAGEQIMNTALIRIYQMLGRIKN
jgi:neutral ceramidase